MRTLATEQFKVQKLAELGLATEFLRGQLDQGEIHPACRISGRMLDRLIGEVEFYRAPYSPAIPMEIANISEGSGFEPSEDSFMRGVLTEMHKLSLHGLDVGPRTSAMSSIVKVKDACYTIAGSTHAVELHLGGMGVLGSPGMYIESQAQTAEGDWVDQDIESGTLIVTAAQRDATGMLATARRNLVLYDEGVALAAHSYDPDLNGVRRNLPA